MGKPRNLLNRSGVTLSREVKAMVIRIQGYYAYDHGETFSEGAIIGMLCEKELKRIKKKED